MRLLRLLYTAPLRIRSLLRRDQVERDLDDEFRDHIERRIEADVARGMTADEARYAALRAFGGVEQRKEECRDLRGTQFVDQFRQDISYACRMMRRTPGFTAIAIASLGIGIGANAVLFSLVDGLMLRLLQVPRPGEVVAVRELWPDSRPRLEVPYWEYIALRDGSAATLSLAAFNVFDRSVDNSRARIGIVSGNYFSTLQTGAVVGRVLTTDDDVTPLAHPLAVISDDYWSRQLRRLPDVLEHTIVINGTPFAIVGVMPRGFTGEWVGRPVDIWVTTMMQGRVMIEAPDSLTRRNNYWLRMVGRLRPGVTLPQADAALQPVYQQTMRDEAARTPGGPGPETLARQRLELIPGSRGFSPERDALAGPIRTLALVGGLILLIVCANLAGLMVSRSAARQREFAVRLAIGAGAGRLTRQLLTETLLLSALGGALGVLFALWGTRAIAAMLATAPVQMFWASSSWISFDAPLGVRGLVFTAAVSVAAGILLSVGALARGVTPALTLVLLGRSPIAGGGRRLGVGQALVALQVALSLVIIVAAALLVRSLMTLRARDLGFTSDRVLLVWTQPSATGRQGAQLKTLWRDVQARLSAIPGIESASGSNAPILSGAIPTEGRPHVRMRVEGQQPRQTTAPGGRTFIQPGFFHALGVPMAAGREFTEVDAASSTPVVIINETMARFYFGPENPVGRRVGFGSETGMPVEIIGVVRDFERGTPRAAGLSQMLTYFPYNADTGAQLVVLCAVVRARGEPRALAAPVREALRAVDPSLAVLKIDTVEEQLDDVLARERLSAGLAGFFGGVAALLACLGLYGLIAQITVRRTAEIGLRIALGATRAGVLGMVLSDGVYMTVAGLAIGVPAAVAATPLLSAQLFGVSARDPITIAAAAIVLLAVAIAAAAIPARRASRVDPMVALREA